MSDVWTQNIDSFVYWSDRLGLKIIMVGGGAVNFHGYQRHSADVDFWIKTSKENIEILNQVFKKMGFEIDQIPQKVQEQQQNISIKMAPNELNLELITAFKISKTFDEAYSDAVQVEINKKNILKWKVLNYDDLIDSKIKSSRNKDLLDIQELERVRKDENNA